MCLWDGSGRWKLERLVSPSVLHSPSGAPRIIVTHAPTPPRTGLYGYDIMTAVAAYGLNEVRMNSRWNRCLFNRAFNWERGHDQQQPTYAYLFTQDKLGDETWRVDGKPNASLPCPVDNNGNLTAGQVYTKVSRAGGSRRRLVPGR